MAASRRTILAALATAAIGSPALLPAGATPARAATGDLYGSNTELYATPGLLEGNQYARRYCRHGVLDDSQSTDAGIPQVAVLAPHGGGIETGTSELCLAIAGYHPATRAVTADGKGLHDYWMFEGLLGTGNGDLHVTSVNCDDPWAESVCGGARCAVALHGCTPEQAGEPAGTEAVLIGGLDVTLRELLRQEFVRVGIGVAQGTNDAIDGTHPRNICNRTLSGAGAQLELTTPLRHAMFGTNTRAERKNTTQPRFWEFVSATRAALALRAGA
ncbi:poly-gamma-glutamate hydrolase family protein [Micromonospora sp. CPCC 205546]|uniref:poly-gamma-glutamate hydrolase family protein n=1 Tax=Micromonospora sp. CPCC 205546 TaxID=3122397 RepID=UPI002FEF1907